MVHTVLSHVSQKISSQLRGWNCWASHSFTVKIESMDLLLSIMQKQHQTIRRMKYPPLHAPVSVGSYIREPFKLGLTVVLRNTAGGRDCPSIHNQEQANSFLIQDSHLTRPYRAIRTQTRIPQYDECGIFGDL